MRRGFTLIELLVVIAIIAILAAILFPILAGAKERGRQAACCSNLKQLTTALRQYSDDYNGVMPRGSGRISGCNGGSLPDWIGSPWNSWSDNDAPQVDPSQGQIWRYVKNKAVFQCPTDAGIPALDADNHMTNFGTSYSMNMWVCSEYNTVSPSSISAPGTVLVRIDPDTAGISTRVLFVIHESRKTINDGWFGWSSTQLGGGDIEDVIHYNGTTCSYVDGHVKWISNTAMKTARMNKLWADNNPIYRAAGW